MHQWIESGSSGELKNDREGPIDMKPRGWVSYRNILGLLVDSLASYEDITFDLFSHTLDVFQEPKLGKEVLHSCNSKFCKPGVQKRKWEEDSPGKYICKFHISHNFRR